MALKDALRLRKSRGGALADGVHLDDHKREDQQSRKKAQPFTMGPQEQLRESLHGGLFMVFELGYRTTKRTELPKLVLLEVPALTHSIIQKCTITQK